MSRLPPGLLYLTIYNPTLRPDASVSSDDEDAEEQSHILFYTARERAVSRDKILRQVGLAKALINFSGMFDGEDACENVHSQSRRMVMISPEPDFWIHACLEVARTPRTPAPKSKVKPKSGEQPPRTDTIYDYHDGSVYDLALKLHILRGYEQFKLTHGSFSSILNTLGQQALELQLERFFTVWAWKWDIEGEVDFAGHLGVPLHPSHRSLSVLLDDFAQRHLPPDAVALALIPPQVVPSSRLIAARYPDVFVRHILSRIPPPQPTPIDTTESPPSRSAQEEDESANPDSRVSRNAENKADDQQKAQANPFDMRNLKWMWSGLTFGKTSSAKSTAPPTPALLPTTGKPTDASSAPEVKVEDVEPQTQLTAIKVEVDSDSLRDAIASEHVHSPGARTPSVPPTPSPPPLNLPAPAATTTTDLDLGIADADPVAQSNLDEDSMAPEDSTDGTVCGTDTLVESPISLADEGHPGTDAPVDLPKPEVRPPPPAYVQGTIYLADPSSPAQTRRRRLFHATSANITLAFVADENHGLDLAQLSEQTADLFLDIENRLTESPTGDLEKSLPTVSKILGTQNKQVLSTGPFTSSPGPPFTSHSEHLFRGRELLYSDLDVSEVFSRGQNPQYWYISKRGLGTGSDGQTVDGEAFMEVARKESTLTDVDNDLAGVIRRFTESG